MLPLKPQRLVWNIQKLGLLGEIDHYCGVFDSIKTFPLSVTLLYSGGLRSRRVIGPASISAHLSAATTPAGL
jgi:hypothetical protein